jgi:hydrogenase 3 maturation protease
MSDCFEGRLAEATRIAVLGVGTELRSDDAAGLLVARQVEKAFAVRSDLLVIQGCSAPENFTGPIIGFQPSHLVVVDCAELEAPPGTVRLFPIEHIAGVSSNTHSLPLNVVFDYILKNCPCEILVVGIQPRSLEFDGQPSKEVVDAARLVARSLIRVVRGMGKQ